MDTSITCDTSRVLLDALREGIVDPPPAAELLVLDHSKSVGDGRSAFGFGDVGIPLVSLTHLPPDAPTPERN